MGNPKGGFSSTSRPGCPIRGLSHGGRRSFHVSSVPFSLLLRGGCVFDREGDRCACRPSSRGANAVTQAQFNSCCSAGCTQEAIRVSYLVRSYWGMGKLTKSEGTSCVSEIELVTNSGRISRIRIYFHSPYTLTVLLHLLMLGCLNFTRPRWVEIWGSPAYRPRATR